MTVKQIAAAIPHEYRRKILLEWIPKTAKADLSDAHFKLLWNAYFVYVDPNGVKKDDCPICKQNVLKTWKDLQKALVEEEQNYNALEAI